MRFYGNGLPLEFMLTILVGVGSIIANIWIAKENAGKIRVIYGTEQMNISQDNKVLKEKLKSMLNSGNYTVLSAFCLLYTSPSPRD